MAHGKYKYTTETFDNGTCTVKRVDDGKTRTYAAGTLPAAIQERLKGHGLLQRLTDGTNKAEGDRFAEMDEIYAQLGGGVWAAERVGGAPTVSSWVEAVARLCKGSIAEAQKTVGALDDETKAKLKASARVVEMTKKIDAERLGSKGLDLSGLLA